MPSILDIFLNEKKTPADKDPKNKVKQDDPEVDDNNSSNDDSYDEDELFGDIDKHGDSLEASNNIKKSGKELDDDQGDSTDDTDSNDDSGDDPLGDDSDTGDDSGEDNSDDGEDPLGDDSMDDGSSDDSGDDSMGDDSGEDGSNDDSGEDNSDDKLKNNKLLQAYTTLYNDADDLIENINTSNKYNTPLEYTTLSRACENLENLKKTMYDYIINLYKDKAYEENLYNYYSILNSIKITKKIVDKIIEIRNKA